MGGETDHLKFINSIPSCQIFLFFIHLPLNLLKLTNNHLRGAKELSVAIMLAMTGINDDLTVVLYTLSSLYK